jgi:magnesium transporter
LASAMILNLGLMAGFAGAVIPLLLKALKFDPALGSGIIVTGLTDAFGFLSFLGLATVFRHYLV